MRTPPVTVSPSETVSTVVHKMVSSSIGCLIVIEDGKSTGLITEKDILVKVLESGKNASQTYARDVMSSPVVTVEYNTSPKDMLQTMQQKNIRRLAVNKKGELVGIITERRILDALL